MNTDSHDIAFIESALHSIQTKAQHCDGALCCLFYSKITFTIPWTEDRRAVQVALCSMSTASLTVDHSILISLLRSKDFLLLDASLLLLDSCIFVNWTQCVCIDEHKGLRRLIESSIPQGSVFSPILSPIYTPFGLRLWEAQPAVSKQTTLTACWIHLDIRQGSFRCSWFYGKMVTIKRGCRVVTGHDVKQAKQH